MNEFDISLAYAAGNHVLFGGTEYVYKPKDERYSFSIGVLPIDGCGWEPKLWTEYDPVNETDKHYICSWIDFDPSLPGDDLTLFYTDSKPNEPTVLDCKDKMINEI